MYARRFNLQNASKCFLLDFKTDVTVCGKFLFFKFVWLYFIIRIYRDRHLKMQRISAYHL